jgi:hypothetical protein
MIKVPVIFLLMISGFSSYSQTWLLETRGKTASYFINIENKLGSIAFKYKYNYIGKSGLAQPIQFRRKENGIPDLLVTYFFYLSDSAIDNIEYDWNESSFRDTIESKDRKSATEIMPYLRKYQEIYSNIRARYGDGKIEGNLDTSGIETDQFRLVNEAKWQLHDSVKLKLVIYISNKYSVSRNGYSSTYTVPQYHIKLTVENPSPMDKSPAESRLSDEKIHALDSVYQLFLSDLKRDDIDSARTRLSPLILNSVSNAQLIELKKLLRLDESLVVFMSGIQFFMDGTKGIMLQYRYESDKETPPAEIVKVIFDHSGRISGIRPIKRQQLIR